MSDTRITLPLTAALAAAALLVINHQNYTADPTNTFPISRNTFLNGPAPSGFNALRDATLLAYLPLAAAGSATSAATTWTDYSGNKLDASWAGTSFPATYRGKISPLAAYWNKTNHNVAMLPAVAIPSPVFSVSAWAALNAPVSGGYTRIAEGDYQKTFYLGTDSTGTKWAFIVASSSATACTSTSAAATGQFNATTGSNWTMITGTYDGTSERLYINGQLQNTCSQAATSFVTTAKAIGLGGCAVTSYCGGAGVYTGWLDGQMQGFRLYSRVLSAAEISALYNAENR